jgi:hypothetical protein
MSTQTRRSILRADAVFLLVASASGLVNDLLGAFAGSGAVARIIASAPHSAIGFVEAHGLAFIIGVLLWRSPPLRSWHLTAACVHLLLGIANLVFWPIFGAADMLIVGYVTTTLHWFFVVLHLVVALALPPESSTFSITRRAGTHDRDHRVH